MRILIAPDSFKDSLDAPAVARALATGLLASSSDFDLIEFPLADGGEGTIEVLHQHLGGEWVDCEVQDPLGRPRQAKYSWQPEQKMAILEMAQASGIQLLSQNERNCLNTSTYGTGQMILDAVERGARHIYLGIGSSATCDGGTGMAEALGFEFFHDKTRLQNMRGALLGEITGIQQEKVLPALQEVSITVICDVENPLYGPSGAAYVYGPQKGAQEGDLPILDAGLQNLDQQWMEHFGKSFGAIPGAGAAGGMGAGTMAFLGATLQPGVELVMELTRFSEVVAGCDWIITGEGSIDQQTLHGKLIKGICDLAKANRVPVIGIGGRVQISPAEQKQVGLQAAFSLVNGPMDLSQALASTASNLERMGFQLGQLLGRRQ